MKVRSTRGRNCCKTLNDAEGNHKRTADQDPRGYNNRHPTSRSPVARDSRDKHESAQRDKTCDMPRLLEYEYVSPRSRRCTHTHKYMFRMKHSS